MHLQLVFILGLGGDSPHEIARRAMNVLGQQVSQRFAHGCMVHRLQNGLTECPIIARIGGECSEGELFREATAG